MKKSLKQICFIGIIGLLTFPTPTMAQTTTHQILLSPIREKIHITSHFNEDRAVVIAGSDKRGTIYGIYELCRQMGVSPWYYWADVPIEKQPVIAIEEGTYTDGEPAVKYRGIFLNDEWPSLGKWASATYGGFNSQFYEQVFELILRLKGNFLWPAMWASAFYDDDQIGRAHV